MKTLASVESFTGGLFASEIVKKPGASKFFKGALVAYDSQIKAKLGVDISKGVINAKVAKELALAGKKYFDVDICVAFTGNAGPVALENKPIGLIYVAINAQVYELNIAGSRTKVRKEAVKFATSLVSSSFF